MTIKSIAQLALLPLLGVLVTVSGVSAQVRGRGSDDEQSRSERFFGYLDRNRDGRLDSEEMRRMPGSFREALERSEINISNGISKDQFVREMPRVMDDARRRREEESRSRGSDDRRSSYRRDDSRRSDDRRSDNNRKGSSAVYTPSKRNPVTMKIPRRFEDGDTDKDGQIGLYEWRQWRPDEKYHFRVYDINGDGFLTPKELSIPPTQDEINNYLTSIGVKVDATSSNRPGGGFGRSRDRGFRGNSRGSSGTPQASSTSEQSKEQSKPAEEPQPNDRYAKTAMVFFKTMDADKNGKITSEEWARSAKLKPKFEKAGYDLSQPMDQQQFITAYTAAYSKS